MEEEQAKADLESVRRAVTADVSALAQTVSQIQGQLTGLYGFIGAVQLSCI